MGHDIELLRFWIRVVCVICSVTTTAVPILYAFSPWRSRVFGRLFMLNAFSLAIAMDIFTLFAFWQPQNILVGFWVRIILLTGIALSTLLMSILMVVVPLRSRKKAEPNDVQRQGISGS